MRAATRGRVEQSVLVVRPVRGSPFEESLRALGVPVVHLPTEPGSSVESFFERALPYCHLAFRLTRYLHERRHGIDVLHPWIFISCVLTSIAGRLAGVPAIVTRVTSIESEIAHLLLDGAPAWVKPLDRVTAPLPSRIIVESRAAASDFRALARPARGVLLGIRSGIDPRALEPLDASQRRELRAEWGADADAPVVGIVARLSPEKRIDTFLEAVARARLGCRALRAVVVGDGPLRATLEAQARRLDIADCTRFLGYRSDARRLMPAFSVLALTSESESSSSVIIEAQMQGVAVVSTSVGGVTDIIVDGETGLLAPIGDPDALSIALVRVLEDAVLRERLAQAGHERVLRLYSAERMVAATEKAYEDAFRAEARGGAVARVRTMAPRRRSR